MARPSKLDQEKAQLEQALKDHGGVVSRVAKAFGVSRQTIYNRLDHHGLRDQVEAARGYMYDLAVDNVMGALETGDLDISKFVLTHMPNAVRWSNKTEITGANGVPLGLGADVLEMLRRLGIEPSEVVKQFEEMVRTGVIAAPEGESDG